MSRSRFAAVDSCCRLPEEVRLVFSSRASRKALSLAAIVPRNYRAKKYVHPTKTNSQKCSAPAPRPKKTHRAEDNKTKPHQWNNGDRKPSRRDNGGSVE